MRNDSVNIQCKHYQESKEHLGVKVTTTGNPDVAVQKNSKKPISINTETCSRSCEHKCSRCQTETLTS